MASTYFSRSDWTRHNDVVYEAAEFVSKEECQGLIDIINTNAIGPEPATWDAESIDDGHELFRVVHQLKDAAHRYAMQEMSLVKVIAHRYVPNSSSPAHADVFPLATLLYLNDDYDGGEIFFDSGLSLKPDAGSLLVFDGGESNKHGVNTVAGNNNRYVLVAFWEYADYDGLQEFWHNQNGAYRKQIEGLSNDLSKKFSPAPEILYENTFPILKISNFIRPELAKSIVEYMDLNQIPGDECYGSSCFTEYYEKEYAKEADPKLVDGITKNTLSEINAAIGEIVNRFYKGRDKHSLVFSKFKGHCHVEGASSPPHTHGPGEVLAVLVLNSDYSGGETIIPLYNISIEHEPYALYVISEENDLNHGVSFVKEGTRVSLISHWQMEDHPYKNAGANI